MSRQPGGNARRISLRLSVGQPALQFKGINGEQFKTAVQAAKNYEEVGIWLQANGTTNRRLKSKPGRMKWKPAA